MKKVQEILRRLRAAPSQLAQILRFMGHMETSRLAPLGAFYWFGLFSVMWLEMLAEVIAAWLDVPLNLTLQHLGPPSAGDFVIGTFFAALMTFISGNYLYGRFVMSRKDCDAMTDAWPEATMLAFHITRSGVYSWGNMRLVFIVSGWMGMLMLVSLLIIMFLE